MINLTFGRYQLLERIAAGNAGETFWARERSEAADAGGTERLVTIERVPQRLVDAGDLASDFAERAWIAANSNHGNVARVFDFGMVDGQFYIALEHIHGRDLRAVFRRHLIRGRALPLAQTCYIGLQACEALDFLHEWRDPSGTTGTLVHGDVCPASFVLSFEGDVKLIDLATTRVVEERVAGDPSWVQGKMRYMSPERMRGGDVDRRADVFSLGAVLFELFTGRRLFMTDSAAEIMRQIKRADVPRPSECNPEIPLELEDIVLGALRERPEDRYRSAAELREDLLAFVSGAGLHMTREHMSRWMKNLYCDEHAAESTRMARLWCDALRADRAVADEGSAEYALMEVTEDLPGDEYEDSAELPTEVLDGLPGDLPDELLAGLPDDGPDVADVADDDVPDDVYADLSRQASADPFEERDASRTILGWQPPCPRRPEPAGAPARAIDVAALALAGGAAAVEFDEPTLRQPRPGSERSLPLPPAPEESGEIPLNDRSRAVDGDVARAFDLLATLPHVPTGEDRPAEKPGPDGSRWSNWTNWPTLATALVALVTGGALLFWNI